MTHTALLFFVAFFAVAAGRCQPADSVEWSDARRVPFDFFSPQTLELPDPLDSLEALKRLFPGHFFAEYDFWDDANVAIWACGTCPKTPFESGLGDENGPILDTFPSPFQNFTTVIGALDFDEKGQRKRAIFFSTSADWPPSGRFSFGALGAAIFSKNGEKWSLQTFSPIVCGEGSYSRAHCPDRVVDGGKSVFFGLVGGYSNGAGAMYNYSGGHLFGLVGGRLERVFFDLDFECWGLETTTNWHSTIHFLQKEALFGDILVETIVQLGSEDDADEKIYWQKIEWWPAVERFLNGRKTGAATVKRRFRFDGKMYRLVECAVD